MPSRSPRKSLSLLDLYRFFLGFSVLEGLLAFWFLFRVPSESRHAFIASFSLQRLGLGFLILVVLVGFFYLLIDSFTSQTSLKFLTSRLKIILGSDFNQLLVRSSLVLILVSSLACLLFYMFPALQRLVFFLPNNYIFQVLGERVGFLLGWLFLLSLQILALYLVSGIKPSRALSAPIRWMAITLTIGVFLFLLFVVWSVISRRIAPEGFVGPGLKVMILFLWFSFWAFIDRRTAWGDRFSGIFISISIGLFIFLVSLQFDQWFSIWGPRPDDQFILLADSFLHGKIYYVNVPFYRHDMNFFNGHWFQSKPPFPILLITPLVAIWGVSAFNINTFALILSSLSAVSIYLIFRRMVQLGWINLSDSGAIWLTVLFEFGTVFWWLSILGTVGPFSQVVTVFFCALAFLIVLKEGPPWLVGICLACAVMSRPNVFVLWPALASIAIQLSLKEKLVNWKAFLKWSVFSIIPVILGVGLLLYYNFLRYGNFLDFGYGTLNGAVNIVQNVNDYGLFSPYFIPINLRVMFLALPEFTKSCAYLLPSGDGISILVATPAVIFVLRKFNRSWWVIGSWCSIVLSIALLAMYSNTGANQYGYRYIMDFFIPVIMIIASNVDRKVNWVLKTLIIASFLINYYGTISSIINPC